MKERVLLGEIAFVAIAEGGGTIAQLRLDIVEDLRSISRREYLFYLSGDVRGDRGKE